MARSFSFLDRRVTIVGIVNVTPDSFSDGGLCAEHDSAVAHALQLVADGAHLIDVGGESTRPGATPVPIDEELRRVVPVIETLAAEGIPVSIDTRRATVASAAIAAGALVVNDVSGLRDPAMIEVVASANVPAIVMHAPSADMAETHLHAGYTDVDRDGVRLPRATDRGGTRRWRGRGGGRSGDRVRKVARRERDHPASSRAVLRPGLSGARRRLAQTVPRHAQRHRPPGES